MTAVRPVARVLAACLALAVAACAATPPPTGDLTPPARRTVDAKTQLERGY